MSDITIHAHTLIIDAPDSNIVLGPTTEMHSFRNVRILNGGHTSIASELIHGDVTHILIDEVGFGSIQKVSVVNGEISIDYHQIVYFKTLGE